MRKLIGFLFIAIGMIACNQRSAGSQNKGGSEKQRLANSVRLKAAAKLKQECPKLRPCGTMGQMMHEIQILGLSFYYYQPVDILEGRKLLVKAVDTMLEEINQKNEIHPYLIRYPFMPRNIDIAIFLRNSDGTDVAPGALRVIEASQGSFCYEIQHPTKNTFLTVYKETYDEAKQRIADPTLPLVPFQPDPEISPAQLARLREGILFVSDDGAIRSFEEQCINQTEH